MNDFSQPVEVSLGRQGRLVIPAALRRELGFEESDALVARQELDRLVLEKPERIKQRLKKRLKQRFSEVPAERKLVEELIAERREGCSVTRERGSPGASSPRPSQPAANQRKPQLQAEASELIHP